MLSIRPAVAALTALTVLAVGAPVTSASAAFSRPDTTPLLSSLPVGTSAGDGITPGACGTFLGPHGQGGAGGTANQACVGAGLSFIGPSIGQIASVVGPTIIGTNVIGNLVNSAGDGAVA